MNNPLLQKWTGPAGGVPPFDKVTIPDLKAGVLEGIQVARKEILAIADDHSTPTFENTIVALEKSGDLLDRVMTIYQTWASSMRTSEFQALESEMALKLAAFADEVVQNAKLFSRIEGVYQSPEYKKLNSEQQRLVWLRHNHFVLKGARLSAEQKSKVAEINQRLAGLFTKFGQNMLADEETDKLTTPDGRVIANTRSAMDPFLTSEPDRKLREQAFRIWASRGDQNNANNNNKIAAQILALRLERSKIFGFQSFAHWKLADQMAKDPQTAMDLMLKVWKPAVAAAKKDIAEMEKIAGHKIEPWDHRFYAEKLRKAKYDVDLEAVKPYMRLDKIRDAMFWMAKTLYGYEFTPIQGVPVFHKDVQVFDVARNGKKIGLFYFDPFARPGKASGAWMSQYRSQQRLGQQEVLSIVSNNSTFISPEISWMDAVTMFHEFGHALHGLSSNVTYPYVSGTNVTLDFVELPSQMHEKFMDTPQVLKFFVNDKGQPLPKELVQKIANSRTFNEGFATVEFLASAIVDMKLHLMAEPPEDFAAFERETLAEIGMPPQIIMRHRIPHFAHIFSGDGYAAGYYAYLWAQVLDNDAFEAFTETGDAFNKDVAAKFFDHVLSAGNTAPPEEAYRKFRGRDATPDALLRARGFLGAL